MIKFTTCNIYNRHHSFILVPTNGLTLHQWISWAQNNLLSLAQAAHGPNWACQLGSPEKHWISVTLVVMLSPPQWVSERSGKVTLKKGRKHLKTKWRAKANFDSNTCERWCVCVCAQMGTQAEDAVRTNMESLRLICDREIPIQRQKMDALTASFRKSLESIRARAQETAQNQGERSHVRGFVGVSLKFLPKLRFLSWSWVLIRFRSHLRTKNVNFGLILNFI